MIRLKLALRNITRHRLRSFLSVTMIAGAVCSIVLFQGFSSHTLRSLKFISAENQFGNMQIAAQKYWNPGKEGRAEKIFPMEEIVNLKDQYPEIERISGRLSFFGLLSNGDLSIGGKVIGVDPLGEPSFHKSMTILEGKFFSGVQSDKEVIVGRLLAKQMNLVTGDNITVLTNTIDGVMNAMDLTISGIFTAGIDEIDGQVVYLPLSVTQEILDTKNVDVAVIKFQKLELAESGIGKINENLAKNHPTLFAKTWRELAILYRQVENFYKVQNVVVEGILLALMFLGILNTVSMTVVERTGEIGTLRSLGEWRRDIVSQFVLESLMVSFIGTVVGLLIALGSIELIDVAKVMTEMPGASTPFQIRVDFLFSSVVYASTLACITTVVATIIPALRAANLDIVEALRKNI
jgi:putative ABC transport system permease protein